MEYILRNTDIFDEQLGTLFNQKVIANPDCFVAGKNYRLVVSFHVNLLHSSRFEEFNVPIPSKANAGKATDKLYDVLGHQLQVLEQKLTDNGVDVRSAVIQGDELEEERIVKVEIIEEYAVSSENGKRKKQKRLKVFSIMPSKPYTSGLATKMAGEELGKIYLGIMNIVNDKKLMSKLLGVEETENDEILFRAFVDQYQELWLATGGERTGLLDQLKDKLLNVISLR